MYFLTFVYLFTEVFSLPGQAPALVTMGYYNPTFSKLEVPIPPASLKYR